jgi:hypothetical protein
MKRSKPFILVSVALLVVWTAWSVQGSDKVPLAWLPGETLFSKAFTQPLSGFGPGYNGALPGGNALLQAFLKGTMKETTQQALPPVNPPASVWTYKIKDGGGSLLTRQSAFYGYFWDTSGRIKNTGDKNGFADLAYTLGPATPHIYLGHDNTKDNVEWRIGDDNATRMMYGVSIDYKVANTFYVIPVFTFYDWGKQLNVDSKYDINKEWISGLQLRIVF